MKTPWSSKYLATLLATFSCAVNGVALADELSLAATTPEVTVSTRPAGRNFLQLPDLTYEFVINLTCDENRRPESLSLSIADTRITLAADVLAGSDPVPIGISVPAGQIGPIPLAEFCIDEDGQQLAGERASLTVRSALSAQVSLLCSDEATNRMTYASQTLDVVLNCEAAPEAPSGSID